MLRQCRSCRLAVGGRRTALVRGCLFGTGEPVAGANAAPSGGPVLVAANHGAAAARHLHVDAARVHRRDLGIALAVPVGFVLGWYRDIRRFIDPLLNFFRALPPIALIPLVIVYFGIGEAAKIVILFYASFFAGVIVMYEGIAQTARSTVAGFTHARATDAEIFRKVIVLSPFRTC